MDCNAPASSGHATIVAGPDAVADAVRATWAYLDGAGIMGTLAERTAIIVEEMVANLIEHGQAPKGSAIDLALARQETGLRLAISDAARPFDPRNARRAETVPGRGGGAGIALVRAWSRIESYESANGRNYLELVIHEAAG